MNICPTYTNKQFWLTAFVSGILLNVFLSVFYMFMYDRLYVESSYLFSIIYLFPLVWLSLTLAFFKWKFVFSEFSYRQAFLLSLCTGIWGSALFCGVIFVILTYFGIESRMEIYNNGERLKDFMSPKAISLSFLIINLILSLFYSLIIAIFARKKITK